MLAAPAQWFRGLVNPRYLHLLETEDGRLRTPDIDGHVVGIAVCRTWLTAAPDRSCSTSLNRPSSKRSCCPPCGTATPEAGTRPTTTPPSAPRSPRRAARQLSATHRMPSTALQPRRTTDPAWPDPRAAGARPGWPAPPVTEPIPSRRHPAVTQLHHRATPPAHCEPPRCGSRVGGSWSTGPAANPSRTMLRE